MWGAVCKSHSAQAWSVRGRYVPCMVGTRKRLGVLGSMQALYPALFAALSQMMDWPSCVQLCQKVPSQDIGMGTHCISLPDGDSLLSDDALCCCTGSGGAPRINTMAESCCCSALPTPSSASMRPMQGTIGTSGFVLFGLQLSTLGWARLSTTGAQLCRALPHSQAPLLQPTQPLPMPTQRCLTL